MNRRKSLSFGTIVLGAISMIPSSVLANNNPVSVFSVADGFNRIFNQISHTSVTFLPQQFLEVHTNLIQVLVKKRHSFNCIEVVT
ncbi:hypothetical protein [Flavivirga eckloniae]|uniref:hypothetical protein n=1 Tax=Flavivirga eckloniae TaxID=1803846 RepID=UPI0013158B1E|nr:hypothetical protein [Flavivirga eckloniae]